MCGCDYTEEQGWDGKKSKSILWKYYSLFLAPMCWLLKRRKQLKRRGPFPTYSVPSEIPVTKVWQHNNKRKLQSNNPTGQNREYPQEHACKLKSRVYQKDHTLCSSWFHSRDARMFQNIQIRYILHNIYIA